MDVFEYMRLADDGCPHCPTHVHNCPWWYHIPGAGQFLALADAVTLPVTHESFTLHSHQLTAAMTVAGQVCRHHN